MPLIHHDESYKNFVSIYLAVVISASVFFLVKSCTYGDDDIDKTTQNNK
jgi:hypothetical protein